MKVLENLGARLLSRFVPSLDAQAAEAARCNPLCYASCPGWTPCAGRPCVVYANCTVTC